MGCIASGALADRFGAGKVFVFGCAALLITSWTFYHSLLQHPDWLFPLYALSGLFVGTIGAVPYVMVKAFPRWCVSVVCRFLTTWLTPFSAA